MPALLTTLARIVPSLKMPIQLAGLAAGLVAIFLIQKVDPNNISAIYITGALMLPALLIPLVFDAALIRELPAAQRAWFLIGMALITLLSFAGAIGFAAYVYKHRPPEGQARFDSKIATDGVKLSTTNTGQNQVQIAWNLFSLSKQENQDATIFTGLVTVHDADKLGSGQGDSKVTDKTCEETKSCLGAYYFDELDKRPWLIRSNSLTGVNTPSIAVNLKYKPKRMKIWWEFYQREINGIDICGFDNAHRAPSDGIPVLARFHDGEKIDGMCFGSTDHYYYPK